MRHSGFYSIGLAAQGIGAQGATRMPPGRSSATSAFRRLGLHDAPLCTRS